MRRDDRSWERGFGLLPIEECTTTDAHFTVGGMQFVTHFNGFLIVARNLFAGGCGCKTIVLKSLQNDRRLARS